MSGMISVFDESFQNSKFLLILWELGLDFVMGLVCRFDFLRFGLKLRNNLSLTSGSTRLSNIFLGK
jgi:hypothetical protein